MARSAAQRASAVLARDENVSVSMIVAHVQATAVDALRSLGVERGAAQEEIGDVARAAQLDGGQVEGSTADGGEGGQSANGP